MLSSLFAAKKNLFYGLIKLADYDCNEHGWPVAVQVVQNSPNISINAKKNRQNGASHQMRWTTNAALKLVDKQEIRGQIIKKTEKVKKLIQNNPRLCLKRFSPRGKQNHQYSADLNCPEKMNKT